MRFIKFFLLLLALGAGTFAAYAVASRFAANDVRGPAPGTVPQHKMLPLATVFGCKDCVVNDIAFSDSGTAWAVAYDGRDPNQIFQSKDSGNRWDARAVNAGGFSLESINFVGDKKGWAVGAGNILHTDNGGATWRQLTRLTGSQLNEVQFVNSEIGYVAGRTEWGCVVLRTVDGGSNWQEVYEATRSGYVFGMATLGNRIVVAAINDDHLIRTQDGGATWKIVDSEMLGASDVTFTFTGIGWVVGRRGAFYRSTDQGKTWDRPANLPESFNTYDWTSISFAGDKGLAVGKNGVIAITSDGGASWSECKTNVSENFGAVRLNNRTGLIIGSQKIYSIVL